MMEIIIWMLAFYMVLKGVELIQIANASSRENRKGMFALAYFTLAVCIVAALGFVWMGDQQGKSSQSPMMSNPY